MGFKKGNFSGIYLIGHISEVCRLNNNRSQAGGYKWKYK